MCGDVKGLRDDGRSFEDVGGFAKVDSDEVDDGAHTSVEGAEPDDFVRGQVHDDLFLREGTACLPTGAYMR